MDIKSLNNSIINRDAKLVEVNNTLEKSKLNFQDLLTENLEKVNAYQLNAEDMDRKFALGEIDNLHDVTIAGMKANLTINMAVEVTNKVLSAYSEIMRLQI